MFEIEVIIILSLLHTLSFKHTHTLFKKSGFSNDTDDTIFEGVLPPLEVFRLYNLQFKILNR